MAQKIILKNSSVTGKIPLATDLDPGELALNTTDAKMFMKKADGTIVEVGGSGGSSSTTYVPTGVDGIYPEVGVETLTDQRHPLSGKPIYTQAFIGTIGSPSADISISTSIIGAENAKVKEFNVYRTNNTSLGTSATWYSSDTSELYVTCARDATSISLQVPDGSTIFEGADYVIVIEYTRIADTNSSPIASVPTYITTNDSLYPKVGTETLTDRRHPVSNKPIYTQTWTGTAPDPANDFTISTGLSGIEESKVTEIVYIHPTGSTLSNTYTYISSDVSEFTSTCNTDGSLININMPDNATNWGGGVYYVILEYTKTADTSSSPIAGVPIKVVSNETYSKVGTETLTTKRDPISNKPIYTQVWSGNVPVPANDVTILTGLTGVDLARVTAYRLVNNSGFTFSESISYNVADTNQIYAFCKTDGTEIYLNVSDNNTNVENSPYYVILEYTKTADTSSSPVASVTIPQLPGDTLQTIVDVIPAPTVHQDLAVNDVIFTKTFTPKSSNSTLIVEAAIPVYISQAGEEVAFGIKLNGTIDSNNTRFVAVWDGDTYGNGSVEYGMGIISNTSLSSITLEVYVSYIVNIPQLWANSIRPSLKITEIQN